MIKIVNSFVSEDVIKKRNKWENDTSIRHFTTPNFEEKELPVRSYETTYIDSILRIEHHDSYDYLVYEDDSLIGECNLMINPDEVLVKEGKTAWLGIVIGEASARGRGIGKVVMEFMEEKAKELGADRIELGVFEFNEYALRLYEKMDYKRIAELDDFTYYNGKWYKDYRLEKKIKANRG